MSPSTALNRAEEAFEFYPANARTTLVACHLPPEGRQHALFFEVAAITRSDRPSARSAFTRCRRAPVMATGLPRRTPYARRVGVTFVTHLIAKAAEIVSAHQVGRTCAQRPAQSHRTSTQLRNSATGRSAQRGPVVMGLRCRHLRLGRCGAQGCVTTSR